MALAVEIRAEAVFLFRNGAVLAQRSEFSGARLERLVERVVSWRQAATDLAVLLGERGGFQRRQLEGERMLLVTYDIDPATFLLALCRSDVPLGTLRLHVRSAADRIARILPQQTSLATSPNTK
jgi:predicted regulator of Ras-like GTPase activity (Roadblock/LC7/MglB family)